MHGHTVESLEAVLRAVDLSGFPIVTSDAERLLVGFASRVEMEALLRYIQRDMKLIKKQYLHQSTYNRIIGNSPENMFGVDYPRYFFLLFLFGEKCFPSPFYCFRPSLFDQSPLFTSLCLITI